MAGQITIMIEEAFRIESFSFHKTEVIYNCLPSRSPPSSNDATLKTSEIYSHWTRSPIIQDERPLRLIGRGADGAKVFEIPDTARAIKISSDSSTLMAEFAKQTLVNKFMHDINQSAVFRMDCHEFAALLPRVPIAFAEHNDSDSKFWNDMGPRLSRPGARVHGHQVKKFPSKLGTAAMVVERIPPLPAPISQMLIRKYFDEDEIAVAYENEDNKDCLIQLQFGVEPVQYEMDSDFEGSDRGEEDPIFSQDSGDKSDDEVDDDDDDDDATICNDTDDADDSESTTISVDIDDESFFSYDEDEDDFDPSIHTTRDFPGTLPQLMDNIPMRLPGLVKTIGTGYAILHFGLFMDGLGTEFVLGGGHQKLKVWMLDFDQCSSLPFSKPVYHIDGSRKRTTTMELAIAIKERILPVLINGGFMPLPKPYLDEGDTEGKAAHKLWEDFKHAYITVGEYCVHRENREELAGAPLQVCLAIEEAMEARANLAVDDILFVEDNEDEENDGLEQDKQADEDDEATIRPKTKTTSNITAHTGVTISSSNIITSTAILTTKYSSVNSIWVGGHSAGNKGIDTSITADYFSWHTPFVALQEMQEAVEDLEMDEEWLAGQEDEEELIRTLPRKRV